jgi:flagellar biosynthetic protein FliP
MNDILNAIRVPAAVVSAGRFVLHFAEMCVAMFVGMAIFMAIPGVMDLPAMLHQLGMAVAMSAPMVGWMKIRGHGWQHGIEMSLGMLLPWAAVLALVAIGAATVVPWLQAAAGPAMLLGMLGVMLLRPGHYAHAHHEA